MKKSNGTVKWIIVGMAVLGFVFNTGVTYNHIHTLTTNVETLTLAIKEMDESIDEINITLASRSGYEDAKKKAVGTGGGVSHSP